jgi:polysaccharide export outer membrane protein
VRIQSRVAAVALLTFIAGCGHVAPFVWVESLNLPPAAETGEYLIVPGDLLSIQVWEQEKMSTRGRVREDGKISFPLLHDVTVAGKAPAVVASDLEAALKPYMLVPRVNVVVEERKPLVVSALGQVGRPGQYVMERGAGVAQVLAAAGGLTPFAHKDRIFVLRESSQKQVRVRLTYQSLTQASSAAAKFRVQVGDVVVVE